MSNDRILYSRTAADIRLSDALTKCAELFPDGVGLFYSPITCQFGKIQANTITDKEDKILDLAKIFEARIFNSQAELRWLNRSNGMGNAVLLSEQNIQNYLDKDESTIQAIDIIDSQYLLWGEGTGKKQRDWSYISAARTGKIAVPIENINRNDRVKLRFREYLSICDRHGNVAIVEERLKGLSK
jgi:CRISPR-associated protein (TIGR03984 family)